MQTNVAGLIYDSIHAQYCIQTARLCVEYRPATLRARSFSKAGHFRQSLIFCLLAIILINNEKVESLP